MIIVISTLSIQLNFTVYIKNKKNLQDKKKYSYLYVNISYIIIIIIVLLYILSNIIISITGKHLKCFFHSIQNFKLVYINW